MTAEARKDRSRKRQALSFTIETDEPVVEVIASRIGQAVAEAVRDKLAKLPPPEQTAAPTAPAQPRPAESRHTGLELAAGEGEKASATKRELKQEAMRRQGLIDVGRVAEMFSVSQRTVYRLAETKAMPQPIKLGTLVRWREVEILAWLDEGCPNMRQWEPMRKRAIAGYESARRSPGGRG